MVAEFEKKFLASTKRDTAFTSTEFVEGNEHGLKYFEKSGKIQVTQSCVLSYVCHVYIQWNIAMYIKNNVHFHLKMLSNAISQHLLFKISWEGGHAPNLLVGAC